MKNVMMAAVAAMTLTTTSALANDIMYIGETEYAFDAETFSLEGGAVYIANDFTFVGIAKFDDVDGGMDFTGTELTASYAVHEAANAYVRVETDNDFSETETSVGVAFAF